MNAKELKKRYIEFFKERGHKIIEQGPLIPENDPTVLFTTAGMHPLIPFLLGQKHPSGKRLVNVQRCLRTDDIMDVGDAFHNTFFEMLGNWSLGDYFKKEAIEWAYEFLTQHLKIDPKRINVTVFAGDKDAPCDSESIEIWMNLGIPRTRIFLNPKKDNWWGPVGETGPCGPDTEIFYDTGKDRCSEGCRPGCKCGKYFELWNLVFMEYNKMKNGKYEKLKQRNVDTGMGVERTTAILEGKDNVYDTELFFPLIKKIRESSKKIDTKAERIIADHIRAAVFIINDGVIPSNIEQGYVLRRLIRRAIRFCRQIESKPNLMIDLANLVIEIYKDDYPELLKNKDFILNELRNEEKRFKKTLEIGLLRFERLKPVNNTITGKDAFLLFQSFGFPIEITKELAAERNWGVDEKGFEEEYKKHQELSKKSIGGIFRSGLQDHSEISKRYHTATHLLHQALREVLGKHVQQKGSNITHERLRFDFSHPNKLTEEEIKRVETLVNAKIREALPVKRIELSLEDAKKLGAIGLFDKKYGEKVSVYFIGNFSKEICAGPHVKNTSEIGKFKIIKESGVSSGIRRIKAVIIDDNLSKKR